MGERERQHAETRKKGKLQNRNNVSSRQKKAVKKAVQVAVKDEESHDPQTPPQPVLQLGSHCENM